MQILLPLATVKVETSTFDRYVALNYSTSEFARTIIERQSPIHLCLIHGVGTRRVFKTDGQDLRLGKFLYSSASTRRCFANRLSAIRKSRSSTEVGSGYLSVVLELLFMREANQIR